MGIDPAPLGCAHGRPAGRPCPHCMGMPAGDSPPATITTSGGPATVAANPYKWDGRPLRDEQGVINGSHPDAFDEINNDI